ncbi:hypothetical protein BD770DRAFT_416546 [Pilaira anomala]|nr:hypothetical protein BD770DRAFT_416546 [Pilaira anomala]
MIMQDSNKKRSDEAIYDIFIKELKKTRLKDDDYILINLLYYSKDVANYERRFMFYEFKDKKGANFKALVYDKLDSSLNGAPIRATKKEFRIEDQEDMYGAILSHAVETEDKEMNVTVSSTRRSPYVDDIN